MYNIYIYISWRICRSVHGLRRGQYGVDRVNSTKYLLYEPLTSRGADHSVYFRYQYKSTNTYAERKAPLTRTHKQYTTNPFPLTLTISVNGEGLCWNRTNRASAFSGKELNQAAGLAPRRKKASCQILPPTPTRNFETHGFDAPWQAQATSPTTHWHEVP